MSEFYEELSVMLGHFIFFFHPQVTVLKKKNKSKIRKVQKVETGSSQAHE